MTRSGYLPRVQDKSVHLTSGLDLFRSGQNFFFCDFPQTMRGVFKPHNSLRLFVFLGKMWVLLALSAKRPCPQSKCRSMGIPPANGSDQNSGEGVYMALMGIPGEDFRLCLPAAPSLTPIRLRGTRTRPIACLRSSLLKWWSGWHRSVLRGFAGWGVVLLALLGKPPCPLSRCQRMDIIILSVAQAATVDMQAVHPCSGKIPPPQTPVMLAGGRPIPTR